MPRVGRPRELTVAELRRRRADLRPGALRRDLLVTGCGGSGTTFVGRLLVTNGVKVTHDFNLGPDGIVTNACDGRHVWVFSKASRRSYVVHELKVPVEEFADVIHVVRHPLKTIGSIYAKWRSHEGVWPHVRATLPELEDGHVTQRGAALYWLRWNERIEPAAAATYRFEQLLEDPSDLFARINRPFRQALDPSERLLPSGATWYPSWDELHGIDTALAEQIHDYAGRCGYTDA